MTDLIYEVLGWFAVASATASAMVLLGGWLWARHEARRVHRQPVQGPYRPTLRKVM